MINPSIRLPTYLLSIYPLPVYFSARICAAEDTTNLTSHDAAQLKTSSVPISTVPRARRGAELVEGRRRRRGVRAEAIVQAGGVCSTAWSATCRCQLDALRRGWLEGIRYSLIKDDVSPLFLSPGRLYIYQLFDLAIS